MCTDVAYKSVQVWCAEVYRSVLYRCNIPWYTGVMYISRCVYRCVVNKGHTMSSRSPVCRLVLSQSHAPKKRKPSCVLAKMPHGAPNQAIHHGNGVDLISGQGGWWACCTSITLTLGWDGANQCGAQPQSSPEPNQAIITEQAWLNIFTPASPVLHWPSQHAPLPLQNAILALANGWVL